MPSTSVTSTSRSAERDVGCPAAPGGTLADYAPFYFAPRSPMLYAVHRSNVDGVVARQDEIVHVVSTCETVVTAGLDFAFTDGHAIMEFSEFFDDLRYLDRVDWEIMQARYWNDLDGTGERPRRRQAEFLVHGRLPWHLIVRIGVMSEAVRDQVKAIVVGIEHMPEIIVRRDWYY
ncbi:type II toxin-antitoxin system toxin DNA ADP-ribosyl transferase DarT [Nonomuraea cavernae]|uniref:type II toxin-antitoxin system toxin DNA ADP-ribosyl transferase DarT n=1 Tax=Nonomuraea cavernae TaxID=2045107 RepID=UPI00341178FE